MMNIFPRDQSSRQILASFLGSIKFERMITKADILLFKIAFQKSVDPLSCRFDARNNTKSSFLPVHDIYQIGHVVQNDEVMLNGDDRLLRRGQRSDKE